MTDFDSDSDLTPIRLELQSYGLDRFEMTSISPEMWGVGRQVDDELMIELDTPEAILAYVRTLPPEITDGWKTSAPRTTKKRTK